MRIDCIVDSLSRRGGFDGLTRSAFRCFAEDIAIRISQWLNSLYRKSTIAVLLHLIISCCFGLV